MQNRWRSLTEAFQQAEHTLPDKEHVASKPWIRQGTLTLIKKRSEARLRSDRGMEKEMQKQVRNSVRVDKAAWLENMLADGRWDDLKKFRNPRRTKPGQLRNKDAELVSSEDRADTMAAYLETLQWRVRPVQLADRVDRRSALSVDMAMFTLEEVSKVIRALRKRKAPAADGIPAELWKVAAESRECLQIIVDFMNKVWTGQRVPDDWHLALVSAIYKKPFRPMRKIPCH